MNKNTYQIFDIKRSMPVRWFHYIGQSGVILEKRSIFT